MNKEPQIVSDPAQKEKIWLMKGAMLIGTLIATLGLTILMGIYGLLQEIIGWLNVIAGK